MPACVMGWFDYIRLLVDLLVELVFGIFYTKQVVPPVNDDVLLLSATQLAKGIRERKFTSERVVRAYIDRINEVNPLINAVVDTRFVEALAEAASVDEQLSRNCPADLESKPFLGVPFTSKESTLCRDMSATFGLKQRLKLRAKEDAAIITNMKNAGGILLAVTNVPPLNLWVETHNPVFGVTRNPYDTSRIAGGSSGGEAALIAACGSPFGVGSDIGGSIRIPSYMCGIFGHKCSNGLTDTKGLTFRDGREKEYTMVTTGPMVRHAEDLISGVEILLGDAAKGLNLSCPVDVTKIKVYYIESNGDLKCSPVRADVAYMNKVVIDHFRQYNSVECLEIPKLKYSNTLFKYWMEYECGALATDITNRQSTLSAGSELWKYLTWRSDYPFCTLMILISSQWIPTAEGNWVRETTDEIRQYLMKKLGSDGVLLFPSWPQSATQHYVGYTRPFNYAYTSIFNVLKFPVTQVPLGLNRDGLPFGIQVVAAPMMDRLCIAMAKELERVYGGYVLPPFPQPEGEGKK